MYKHNFRGPPCSRLDCLYLNSVLLSLDSWQGPIHVLLLRNVNAFSGFVRSQIGGIRLHTLYRWFSGFLHLLSSPTSYFIDQKDRTGFAMILYVFALLMINVCFLSSVYLIYNWQNFLCSFDILVFPSKYLIFVLKCVVFERETWVKKERSDIKIHLNVLKPKSLCTTSFKIQKFCVLPVMHLCILRGSQNKERLFLYTALTYRVLSSKQRVFTARYGLDL